MVESAICSKFYAIKHVSVTREVVTPSSSKRGAAAALSPAASPSWRQDQKVFGLLLAWGFECCICFLTLSFTQVLDSNCFMVEIEIWCSCGLYCPSCAIYHQLWLWTFKDDLLLGGIREWCCLVILPNFLSVWVKTPVGGPWAEFPFTVKVTSRQR